MSKGILLAATVEAVRTRKDHTLSVTLGTQELSPEEGGRLLAMSGKLSAVYICEKESVPQDVLDQVDKAQVDRPGKSQSQRLRAILYKLFEQEPEGYGNFDEYYHSKTEAWITKLKTKLP